MTRVCVACGCTDDNPCIDELTLEACSWVEGYGDDLCSACAAVAIAIADSDERDVARQIPRAGGAQ